MFELKKIIVITQKALVVWGFINWHISKCEKMGTNALPI